MLRESVIAASLLCAGPGCWAGAKLSFAPATEIGGERIRVADIARINADVAGSDELLELDLGQAPYPGRVERLKPSSVMAWIGRRLPRFAQLEWEGPDEVTVRVREHTIPFDEVVGKSRQALAARLGVDAGEIELDPLARKKDLLVPARPYVLSVAHIEIDGTCRRVTALTQAVANGRVLASVPLQFLLAGLPAVQVPAADEVCGKTRRAVLQQDQAGRGYAINRFAPVTVELRVGGLMLETAGIALANGGVGELVRVRPADGAGQYQATVVAPGRVSVAVGASQ